MEKVKRRKGEINPQILKFEAGYAIGEQVGIVTIKGEFKTASQVEAILHLRQMKQHFDKKKHKVGDLVLWSGAKKNSKDVERKTGIKFGGPYKITNVLGNDRYKIVALKGMKGYQRYSAVVAADALRPFNSGAISDSDSSESEANSTDDLIDLLES